MVPTYLRPGPMLLGELLQLIQTRIPAANDSMANYGVYAADELEINLTRNTSVFLSGPVEVTDDLDETYPQDVQREGLWILCERELIEDVVDSAVGQQADVSVDQLVACLKHYLEREDFLDFS